MKWEEGGLLKFPQETSLTHPYLCIALVQGREDLLAPSFSTAFSDRLPQNGISKACASGLRSAAASQVVTKSTTALC